MRFSALKRGLFAGLSAVLLSSVTVVSAGAGAAAPSASPPHITSVEGSPSVSTGGNVVIHGDHFAHLRSIHFGAVAAHHIQLQGHTIYVTAPHHGPGRARITVTTAFGTSRPAPFSYLSPNPLTWTRSKPFDLTGGEIRDLACSGPSLCAAVDSTSAATFDGTRWTAPELLDPSERMSAVACGSPTSCLAFSATGKSWKFDGTDWQASGGVGIAVTAASCPDQSLCMAISDNEATTLEDGMWSQPVRVTDGRLSDLSCPSVQFCLAGGAVLGVYQYDGAEWTKVALPAAGHPGVVTSVECTSPQFCAAVDDAGNVYTFDGTWSTPTRVFMNSNGRRVACASATDCVALDLYGDASHWDGATWSAEAPVDTSPQAPVHGWVSADGLACSSTGVCYYGQSLGEVVRFEGAAWKTPRSVFTPTGFPTSVSCWAPGHCKESDEAGSVQALHHTTWTKPHNVIRMERDSSAISCVSATFCALVAGNGRAATFNGTSWSHPVQVSDDELAAVSCTSASFCIALARNGLAYRFNGSTWTAGQKTGLANARALSCSTSSSCLATGESSVSRYTGTRWTAPYMIDTRHPGHQYSEALATVDCPSSRFCALGDDAGYFYKFVDGTWHGPTRTGLHFDELNTISCTSPSFCAASAFSNTLSVFDGTHWSDPAKVIPESARRHDAIRTISCTARTFCVSVGWHSAVVSR